MNSRDSDSLLITTTDHYEVLDGLRGVAAVAIVLFHFMEIIIPDFKDNFIAHGYLAVDFFFCLSGFVISYAYDTRIIKIGVLRFLTLRLIRLHPLVVIGSVLGLLSFLFDPFVNLSATYTVAQTVQLFVTSLLMIPYPVVAERYYNFFHLNAPMWSLFWEYVANIIYAVLLFKLRNKMLWFLVVIAAVLLCNEAYRSGNLVVGWGQGNFWGGGVRVFYSFLAGMLVYRSRWMVRSPMGFVAMSLLLLAAFLVPYSEKFNWIIEPIMVMFYFPAVVALGAGANLGNRSKAICELSGRISYPLYMVHYPFMWIFLSYVQTQKPAMGEMMIITCIGVLLLIALAYLVMNYIDVPVRNFLRKRLRNSAKK
jgi:peptidoglycan/LPS O-acetylase OafA/YrhL